MARSRRARADVSRSAATACYAAGTRSLSTPLGLALARPTPTYCRTRRSQPRLREFCAAPRAVRDPNKRRATVVNIEAERAASREIPHKSIRALRRVSVLVATPSELLLKKVATCLRHVPSKRSKTHLAQLHEGEPGRQQSRITPQFSGRALPCEARRVCIMK
jgi:hypothetical protein